MALVSSPSCVIPVRLGCFLSHWLCDPHVGHTFVFLFFRKYSVWDLLCLLWRAAESLVVACELFVATCGI